jgi:hypothetical protein
VNDGRRRGGVNDGRRRGGVNDGRRRGGVNDGGRRGGHTRAAFYGCSRLRALALHESDEITKSQGPITSKTQRLHDTSCSNAF